GLLEPTRGARQASRYVIHQDGRYMLAPGVVAACDLWAFDEAMAAGDRARAQSPEVASLAYQQAIELYHGDLFDEVGLRDNFEEERDGYRARALAALAWLEEDHRVAGDEAAADASLARAVAIAPHDEALVVRHMAAEHAAGRPDVMRQAYWACRKAVKE